MDKNTTNLLNVIIVVIGAVVAVGMIMVANQTSGGGSTSSTSFTPSTPSTYCGDGSCNSGETCSSCPEDCGACYEPSAPKKNATITEKNNALPENYCGDDSCNPPETCDSCPSDCGNCPCGDGTCGNDETCSTCPEDCGACKTLGKRCDSDLECESGYCVHKHCRPTSPFCRDTYCDPGETRLECPTDCGQPFNIGDDCTIDGDCKDGHCVHEVCVSSNPSCGDGYCDPGELCGSDCGIPTKDYTDTNSVQCLKFSDDFTYVGDEYTIKFTGKSGSYCRGTLDMSNYVYLPCGKMSFTYTDLFWLDTKCTGGEDIGCSSMCELVVYAYLSAKGYT